MNTFTWTPDIGSTRDIVPNLFSVKFGENYEQTGPAGLNPIMETRSLPFTNRTLAESQAINAFLEAQCGATFAYTHPNGTLKNYKCKHWTVKDVEGVRLDITADFQQVPL